ncbi:sperm-associated antigen 1 [Episyrphus balteatus]|uniref:sperm-associated antigen 1 n=1 Tax=Episyrphus balteatus TaxID=286459 RepID=UPI0024859E54|nr:sperm-associated antigen 1 [Episyrphus balteatus]
MEKRTLLQKYEIPISHLDFDYVKNCKNTKELERIVAILRSGEEGYYPDLTKCAEDKLRELKPQSRALRTEERLITKHSLSSKDWQELSAPISEWSADIKTKDSILSKIQDKSSDNISEVLLPPIRKGGKVDTKKVKDTNEEGKKKEIVPVATTNYSQWEKYDADAELLKMDLEEERNKEQVERMNRLNQKKSAAIEVISESKPNVYDKLSTVEKEKLSEDYKIRGNEYFKAKEYTSALEEYSRCLEIQSSVAGFNNRAITNLKLQKYEEALSDCNECLQLDKTNLKALLRKAEACLGMERKHDAFRTYEQIRQIEPTNAIACKGLERLSKELGDVAPLHATRLQIMECETSNNGKPIVKHKSPVAVQQKPKPKPPIDYDLAELIKPNKLVKNSLMKTMENLGKSTAKMGEKTQNDKPKKTQFQGTKPEFKLQIKDSNSREEGGKFLIQEL